jgi:hypothetical protein
MKTRTKVCDAVSGAQRSELAGVLSVPKGGAGDPGAE